MGECCKLKLTNDGDMLVGIRSCSCRKAGAAKRERCSRQPEHGQRSLKPEHARKRRVRDTPGNVCAMELNSDADKARVQAMMTLTRPDASEITLGLHV